jgi:alkanesulfonate monooxygenase
MGIKVFWLLPTDSDGRALSPELWNRGDYAPTRPRANPRTGGQRDGFTVYDHFAQIAGAADLARFDGLWIPHGSTGEEPLIVAGAIAREARHVKLVPSLRAPLLSAVYAAKIANSFQRLSGGRLAWNLITVDDPPKVWHGRHWSIAEQIERTGEFLDVAKGFWNNAPFTYQGKYYEVENGGFAPALQGPVFPIVYLSGETDEAYALSARHADIHVLPLLPVDELAARIARLRDLAGGRGRSIGFAVKADIVARHTDDEAWADLRARWADSADRTVVPFSSAEAASAAPTFEALIANDNLWTGFDFVHPGGAAGLVGSYDNVSERVGEYYEAGVDTFILGSNPSLNEVLRVGEKILPQLRARAASSKRQAA